MQNYNAETYMKWCRLSTHKLNSNYTFCFKGAPDWYNLQLWLEAYYWGETSAPSTQETEAAPGANSAARLFSLVDELYEAGCSWDQTRRALRCAHGALADSSDAVWRDEDW